jgi:hypothetical protein
MIPAATGNTTPTRLLNSRLTPRLTASVSDHRRGCGSSSSIARRNAHIDSATLAVNMTSGIRMRVNSHRPKQVAITSPAYIPARFPNAHVPNAAVIKASRMAESTTGIRAAQSCAPKIL